MRWHCPGAPELLWRECDGEYFVFNPASGLTHVVNQVSAEIIDSLGEGPMSEAMLAEHFALAEDQSATDFQQVLHQHLLQLEHLGLIDRHYHLATPGTDNPV